LYWELINALGYSEILLPKIAEPGTFIGDVGKHIPQLTGTPIFLGMGDNQGSVLGAIFEKKFETSYNKTNSMVISIGTSGQISAVVKETRCTY
jgi:sugar (pentulose or hexulose) kinase